MNDDSLTVVVTPPVWHSQRVDAGGFTQTQSYAALGVSVFLSSGGSENTYI